MEATAAARGVPLTVPPPSQASRKEWRAVPEHSVRTSGNEDVEHFNLGQSDERLIYEQQLHSVVKQREDLQHLEIDIKARLVARSEVMEMQESFDSQIKEQMNVNVKLQEQLHEREKTIHELERTMEEKEKELHAIRLDHEAAWAKEDLLREQSKELASYRRERDNSEAERAQHLKQIHDLQEHIQEKDRQFMEIQEQYKVSQENIIYKDEQLREAQAWIARVQEMDHSLQGELRERTEQYNQLWVGCQRQFAEMERIHLLTVHQLQLELADVREKTGTYSDETHTAQANLKDATHFEQINGSQPEVGGGGAAGGSSGVLPNGNGDNLSSFSSAGNTSTQTDQGPGAQIAPQSLLGMPSYLQSGQVTTLHPFLMHQQGVPQSVPSHVPQSHIGHFHSVPAFSSLQHWQNQQALSESSQMQNQYTSPNDQNSLRQDVMYDYQVAANGQAIHTEYLDAHVSQGLEPHVAVPSPNEDGQAIESTDKSYMASPSQQSLEQISSQFHGALRLDPLEHTNVTEEKNNHGVEAQSMIELPNPATNTSEAPIDTISFETSAKKTVDAVPSEGFVSSGQKTSVLVGKTVEPTLLDEESLLACVVRTIPPGGTIRISSTLPNRLGKMLAPLHWHDYKKKYGKLDDFLGSHPELFVIEGDFIQLRDGAQEIIAAMAARAKVRAAAAAAAAPTSAYPSLLPPVAVTPMAQSQRLKKAPSIDSKSGKLLAMKNQNSNGVSSNAFAGIPGINSFSKPKDQMELNGSETRQNQASVLMPVGNGTNSAQGRPGASFSGKQQGRSTGFVANSRR